MKLVVYSDILCSTGSACRYQERNAGATQMFWWDAEQCDAGDSPKQQCDFAMVLEMTFWCTVWWCNAEVGLWDGVRWFSDALMVDAGAAECSFVRREGNAAPWGWNADSS